MRSKFLMQSQQKVNISGIVIIIVGNCATVKFKMYSLVEFSWSSPRSEQIIKYKVLGKSRWKSGVVLI